MVIRWPGKIPAGTVSNEIIAHQDWLPTLLAAAGDPDIKEKLDDRPSGRRQNLQGAYRRLQFLALSDRRRRERAPAGLYLLL
jgi:arylsulfatase A-like enzyme